MGRNRRHRHSTKQHKQSARLRARIDPSSTSSWSADTPSPEDTLAAIHIGARAAHGPIADAAVVDRIVDLLVRATADDRPDPEATMSAELTRAVTAAYEAGWQPLDIAHVVRHLADAQVTRLAHHVIAIEAVASDAATRAPAAWRDQLSDLAADLGPSALDTTAPQLVTQWRRVVRIGAAEGWYTTLTLLGILQQLPRLTPIAPRPSQWGTYRPAAPRQPAAPADPKMLARIRALLAKAEATTFEAEAESFTAKAQDLMTRHAIDAAVLLAGGDHDLRTDVVARRVHIANPYASEKVDLLAVVCRANGVRTVWHQGLWFATVVGLPVDLDVAELLFTSLLVQVNRAISDASSTSAQARSRAFRRAFMVAYAHRIGERLDEATEQANSEAMHQYGTALVPVLAARTAAVEAEFSRLFPTTRASRGRRLDAQGWAAGRAAADQAELLKARGRLRS